MTRTRFPLCLLLVCGCENLLGVHDIVPVVPIDAPPNPSSRLSSVVTRIGDTPSNFFQVVDINADGRPDVFAVNQFFVNTTARGGAPTFTASPFSLVNGSSAGFVDLNADEEPDLLDFHGNLVPDTVNVFPNTTPIGSTTVGFGGKTTITGSISTATDFAGIVFGDVDGDDKPDMVEFHASGIVSVYVNTTTLGATSPTFASRVDVASGVGATPLITQLHDLNGDGKLDVLEMLLIDQNTAFTNAAILVNTSHLGAPSFQPISGIPGLSGCNQFGFADLDGDGFVDIVAACDQSVNVLRNTTRVAGGDPTFAAPVALFSLHLFTDGLVVTDLDGDGKPDLVIEPNAPGLYASINTGTPGTIGFSDPVMFTPLECAGGPLIGADINGDGNNDIVTTADSNSSVGVVVLIISSASP